MKLQKFTTMESKGMDELLKKYYNGETSIDEERLIKDFLKNKNNNNPDEELIAYFNNYKEILPKPENWESEIETDLNRHIGKRLMRKKVLNSVIYGIAAGIMLIFVIRNLVLDGNVGINNMTASANISYCIDSLQCENEIIGLTQIFSHFHNDNLETIITDDINIINKSVYKTLERYSFKKEVVATFIKIPSIEKIISKIDFPNQGIKNFIASADEIYIFKISENLNLADKFLKDINEDLKSNFKSDREVQICNLYLNKSQDRPSQSYFVEIIGDKMHFYVFKY